MSFGILTNKLYFYYVINVFILIDSSGVFNICFDTNKTNSVTYTDFFKLKHQP